MTPIRYNAYSSWGTDFTATLAAGATFIQLNDIPADVITLVIPTTGGVSLDVINSNETDKTKYMVIDAPSGFVIPVGGNAAEIMIRRHDQSATPVTVRYMWGKFRR